MQKWSQFFRKNTGLSPYVWVVFYILPFYFFHSSTTYETAFGIAMIILFFICYVLSFVSKGWLVYFWTSIQIVVSTVMSIQFAYIYFSLFLAFFIGNLKNRIAFIILYLILLISTFSTVNYGLFMDNNVLFTQLPFVFLSLLAVVLLPVSTFNKNKEELLQGKLEDANKRINELVKLEERQRIARDLHDTLGQKLSLIGLKSDLASRLIAKDPSRAKEEIQDVQKTARIALKEVREMVTKMRGTKLEDEIFRVKQILKAADIEFITNYVSKPANLTLMVENVISMCVKEAVTNVVKHSSATTCSLNIHPTETEVVVEIEDNGVGIQNLNHMFNGNGLKGMQERLEFVNGSLDTQSNQGTKLVIKVPISHKQVDEGV
ncbi:sensor histidine kinase [Neobacillus sp. D3-1R]|uniref:sensor histidine kinase n=1 Tax=Neobacillus sp. D3-1R TaxID=3445778 RepID=UPI003F9F6527